jgi:hypothetical protein
VRASERKTDKPLGGGVKPPRDAGRGSHPRGDNMRYIEETLGFKVDVRNWDYQAEKLFYKALDEYGLKGEWIEERY